MPPIKTIVLDTNVIAALARARPEKQAGLLAPLHVAKRKDTHFVLTTTIVNEVGRNYTNPNRLKKLVAVARLLCDGILPLQAWEVTKIEIEHDDPYSIIAPKPLLPIEALDHLEDAAKEPALRASYAAFTRDRDAMRSLLSQLDPAAKLMKQRPLSFREYVEGRREAAVSSWFTALRDRGKLSVSSLPDLNTLWKRGAGLRLLVLVQLANEWRRLTKTQKKGEGCLTDLRSVAESAYCHEIWTEDVEFIECVRLAKTVSDAPKARQAWPSSA